MKEKRLKITATIFYTVATIVGLLSAYLAVGYAISAGIIFFQGRNFVNHHPFWYPLVRILTGDGFPLFAFQFDFGYASMIRFPWNSVFSEVEQMLYLHLLDVKKQVSLMFLSVSVWFALVTYGAYVARRIMKPMKEGKPFAKSIAGDLRRLAAVTFAAPIGSFFLWSGWDWFFQQYQMAQIGFESQIKGGFGEYFYAADYHFIWITVTLLFLSYIFSYGQALQWESDGIL